MPRTLSSLPVVNLSPQLEALLELQAEMRERSSELFALYIDSRAGFELLSKHLGDWKQQREESYAKAGFNMENVWKELQDFAVHPPPHGHAFQFDDFARSLLDYEERNRGDGKNGFLIGNYLLVALYQFWDHTWRSRIAVIVGHEVSEIQSDFWGDLRLIRNRLLHNGVADENLENNLRILRWFKAGETIFIDYAKTAEIVARFFQFMYTGLLS